MKKNYFKAFNLLFFLIFCSNIYAETAYTIQLLGSANPLPLKQLVTKYKKDIPLKLMVSPLGNSHWYSLFYGKFKSHNEAEKAYDNLPSELKEEAHLIRSIESVQDKQYDSVSVSNSEPEPLGMNIESIKQTNLEIIEIKGGCFTLNNKKIEKNTKFHCIEDFKMNTKKISLGSYMNFVQSSKKSTSAKELTIEHNEACFSLLAPSRQQVIQNQPTADNQQNTLSYHPLFCVSFNKIENYLAWLTANPQVKAKHPQELKCQTAFAAKDKTKDNQLRDSLLHRCGEVMQQQEQRFIKLFLSLY